MASCTNRAADNPAVLGAPEGVPKTGQSTVMARMKVLEKNWWTIRESLLGSYACFQFRWRKQ